ncbi:DUF1629 domain-containing protein (plasmid) [Thioclava sp. 'Guangxiensis']|uniref:imm11 family protein n=1 Tax=Thioclava sp. 'Guangxiensis' TaxID=3149044 RepID=UPI0032C4951B
MTDWCQVEEPKIWISRFPRFLDIVSFDWSCHNENKIEFIDAFQYLHKKVDAKAKPQFLYFRRHRKVPSVARDAFLTIDGLQVISQALRDVLVQFDMTGVQLFEVPILADLNGAPSGLPNHFVMNVYGTKDALIPELSENIERPILRRETEPRPDAKWEPINDLDVPAVSASAGEGADIWCDPNLGSTYFFSDRLKSAIDAADLKVKALKFSQARVFEAERQLL